MYVQILLTFTTEILRMFPFSKFINRYFDECRFNHSNNATCCIVKPSVISEYRSSNKELVLCLNNGS